MKEEKYVLAVDHGTSGVKTSLVSVSGRVAGTEFRKTPVHFLPGGGAEQDPGDWWAALMETSRRLVESGRVPVERIAAVSVSSTFSTTVAVDRGGSPLGPALTWMDSRGAPYVREAMKGFPSVMGYGLGKALRWLRLTAGAPSLSGKDDIGHVLYWKHEEPEVYRGAHLFLPSKDYLNLRLTGRSAASFDSIQLFWVTDTRKVEAVRYDDGLIRLLGIDRRKLPPLRASTDILGPLLPEVADEIGLPRETPVVMGAADHQCALVGSGAVEAYAGHLYVGTSSWVQCIVPFKKTDLFHSIASLPAAIPGRYQSVNEQDLAGGCLGLLAENILFHRDGGRLGRVEPPADPYGVMDEVAEGVEAGSGGLIFTPWLNGERTPVDDPFLRGGLYNISKTTTLGHVVRAVMEGVAYNTRWSLGYVERFVGRRLDPLHVVGGGARSDLWCRIFADVLDREIRRVEDPLQANARGAAWIAAVGLGYLSFEEVPGRVVLDGVFRPEPANRRVYDELFAWFLRTYRNNRRMYYRLNRPRGT